MDWLQFGPIGIAYRIKREGQNPVFFGYGLVEIAHLARVVALKRHVFVRFFQPIKKRYRWGRGICGVCMLGIGTTGLAAWMPPPVRAPIIDAHVRQALPACPFDCVRLFAHPHYTRLVLCLPPGTPRPVAYWQKKEKRLIARVRFSRSCTPVSVLNRVATFHFQSQHRPLLAGQWRYALLPRQTIQLMWSPIAGRGAGHIASVRTGYLLPDTTHRTARWVWDFISQDPQHRRVSGGRSPLSHRSLPRGGGYPPSASVRAVPVKQGGKQQPVRALSMPVHRRRIIVVIDPGHGGKDPGAIGMHGLQEKHIALAIAKQLYRAFNASAFFHAYLTRSTDHFIPLRGRVALARAYHADVFIAVHADAYFHPYASGASVYVLSEKGATSEAAKWLANKANREVLGGIAWKKSNPRIQPVILNLQQGASIRASLRLGEQVLQHLHAVVPLHHNHVEQAAFAVLKSPDIPSILVETGFLSNQKDAAKLTYWYYQRRLARAIVAGTIAYYRQYPLQGSRLSAK